MVRPSALDAAYAAGLLDGEGSIHIGEKKGLHRLQVQIINTNRGVLEWLQDRWGGSIYEMRGNSRHRDWSRCWSWACTGREDTQSFLEAIVPQLIIKRRAVEIAMQFLLIRPTRAGLRLPPVARTRRRDLFLELRGLPRDSHERPEDQQLAIEMEAHVGA